MTLANFQETWFSEVYSNKPLDEQRNVHRTHHYSSLTDALAQTFGVTKALVGDDYFNQFAKQYIDTHKLASPSVDGYGDKLASFAAATVPLDYLADVVKAEWQIDRLKHHQPSAPNLSGLTNVDNANSLYLRANNIALLKSKYAVATLINQVIDNALEQLDIESTEFCLIDSTGAINTVSEDEFNALALLVDGIKFNQLDHHLLGDDWVVRQIQNNIIDEVTHER